MSTQAITNLEFDAPVKTISEANNRDHWRKKSERRKSQQQEVDIMLLNALQGRKVALPCVVKLTRIGAKVLDSDNLAGSFKAVRDAIARRIGIDDGDSRIRFEYDQAANGRREYNIKVSIISI